MYFSFFLPFFANKTCALLASAQVRSIPRQLDHTATCCGIITDICCFFFFQIWLLLRTKYWRQGTETEILITLLILLSSKMIRSEFLNSWKLVLTHFHYYSPFPLKKKVTNKMHLLKKKHTTMNIISIWATFSCCSYFLFPPSLK